MDSLSQALSYASRLLKIRPRSEKEIRDRVAQKDFGPEIVEKAVTLLKKNGHVDDALLAGLMVEDSLRDNIMSAQALALKMAEKGLGQDAIDRVLAKMPLNDRENARRLVSERLAKMKGVPQLKLKARLYALLLRKGFEEELAREIIEGEIASSPDASEGSSQ